MCGIAGFVESPSASTSGPSPGERLQAMLDTMTHRGPDDWGMAFFGCGGGEQGVDGGHIRRMEDGNVRLALGHRRLSIIDLSPAGRQPMSIRNGDCFIVANGEIYNYIELKGELGGEIEYFSRTDIEVLLHAYRLWGVEMLRRLDGMFSFAIYDRRRGRLFCARDPLGIKPFYYAVQDGRFLFASEPGAVLAGLGTAGHIDPTRTAQFLVMGNTDHDAGTFYREVRQLPGGHWFEVGPDGRTTEPRPFWTPPTELLDEGAPVPELMYESIRTSVSRQLRSDVPLGGCLSGGLDSGALTVVAGELLGAEAERFTTLTLYNPDFKDDETALARRTAQMAGNMRWVPVVQELDRLHGEIGRMIGFMGEPVSTLSMLAQFKVMEKAGELGLKVMLDGQGGDELFLGYPRMAQRIIIEHLRRGRLLPAAREWFGLRRNASLPLHRTLLGNIFFSSPRLACSRNSARLKPYVEPELLAQIDRRHISAHYRWGDLRERQIRELTRYCLPRLLRYGDRNSMAFSVESRVPHLSAGTVDLALRLPSCWKVRHGWTKYALRMAMRGRLPEQVLWNRVKRGFDVPQRRWVESARGEIAAWLQGLPPDAPIRAAPVIDAIDRGAGGEQWLWRVICVGLWMLFLKVKV